MGSLTRNQWIAVAAGLVVIAMFFVFGNPLGLFSTEGGSYADSRSMQDASTDGSSTGVPGSTNNIINPGNLQIQDVTVGSGAEAAIGDTVTVNYTGSFPDGTVFDSSIPRGQPFSFKIGAGNVIAGWEQGLQGMRVGGKRRLVVPPELGYGPNDYGPIPGNSTLLFDIELLKIEK